MPPVAGLIKPSNDKLFHRDAFVEALVGIEQQSQRPAAVGGDQYGFHVADFALVGDRADRAFCGLADVEADARRL